MPFITNNLVSRIIGDINVTCRPNGGVERGQTKTVWREVLRLLMEEYQRLFHEEYQ